VGKAWSVTIRIDPKGVPLWEAPALPTDIALVWKLMTVSNTGLL